MKIRFELKSFLDNLPRLELAESVKSHFAEAEVNLDELYVKRMGHGIDIKMDGDEERTFVGYASTRELDRDDEIVMPDGIDLSHYKQAPVLLWGHSWSELPLGSAKQIASDGYGLIGKASISDYPFAEDVWKLVQGGHLKTSSIGFVPTAYVTQGSKEFGALVDVLNKDWGEFSTKTADKTKAIITKSLLLEWSLVSVPANIQSLVGDVSSKSAKRFGVAPTAIVEPPEPTMVVPEEQKGFTVYRTARNVPEGASGFINEKAISDAIRDQMDLARGKV